MPTVEPTTEPTSNRTVTRYAVVVFGGNCVDFEQTLMELNLTELDIIKLVLNVSNPHPRTKIRFINYQCGSIIMRYSITGENATLIDLMIMNAANKLILGNTTYIVQSHIQFTLNPTLLPTQAPTNYPSLEPTPRPTIHVNSLWEQQSSRMPLEDSNMAIGFFNSFIYLIGGITNQKSVTRYDADVDEFWFDTNAVSQNVYGFAQFYTQVGAQIFMIDYYGTYLNVYSMETQTLIPNWSNIPRRVNEYGCLTASNHYLLVIGGVDNSFYPLDYVQALDLNTNQWFQASPMIEPRDSLSCVYDDATQKVFAIGGFGNSGALNTVEYIVSDPREIMEHNTWTMMNEQLSEGIYESRAISFNGWIWIIGGSTDSKIDTVHIIDPVADSISVSPQTLSYAVSSPSVVLFRSTLMSFGGITNPFKSLDIWMKYIQPTTQPTMEPTLEPTLEPTYELTINPTDNPTPVPTQNPTVTPSKDPTKTPTSSPTKNPSDMPTKNPSKFPTVTPTKSPSKIPTKTPSQNPTKTPSQAPTSRPSDVPTKTPSKTPTKSPSKIPTKTPSQNPTKTPSQAPTSRPSDVPTKTPSKTPTKSPSKIPTKTPSQNPTKTPSQAPTSRPSDVPTKTPSTSPTKYPTHYPSITPTNNPTHYPSKSPPDQPTNNPSHTP
eukprot:310780_1